MPEERMEKGCLAGAVGLSSLRSYWSIFLSAEIIARCYGVCMEYIHLVLSLSA